MGGGVNNFGVGWVLLLSLRLEHLMGGLHQVRLRLVRLGLKVCKGLAELVLLEGLPSVQLRGPYNDCAGRKSNKLRWLG
jgi:hypothetical protein